MQFIAVAVPSENQIRRQSALRMEAPDNFGRLIDGKFSAAGNKRLGNKPRTCRCHAVQRNGVAFSRRASMPALVLTIFQTCP